MRLLVALVLAIGVTICTAGILPRQFDERHSRHIRVRRDASSSEEDLHDWLTTDQKAELKTLKASSMTAFKDKVMELYAQLPADQKEKWNGVYKQECVKWIKKVGTEAEVAELKKLFDEKKMTEVEQKVATLRKRLSESEEKEVALWEEGCRAMWIPSSRRLREATQQAVFEAFTNWMSAEEKKEIDELAKSGKSHDEVRSRAVAIFDALPLEKQTELKGAFKGECKKYFTDLSTPEEVESMKSLYDAGKTSEAKDIVDAVIERQTGEAKETAKKVQDICIRVFKQPTRRSVETSMDKHLSWLSPEQKEEIRSMHAAGKSQSDIKAKLFEFINGLDGDKKADVKEKTQKECYKWMDNVATKEEIESLHKLHHVDHDACKKRVREFIDRLGAEEKKKVESNLEFCEKVWYGDHGSHKHHGHNHKRRQLQDFENYNDYKSADEMSGREARHTLEEALAEWLTWLTEDQRKDIVDTYASDKKQVYAKVLDFYESASGAAKDTATKELKEACRHMISEAIGDENAAAVMKLKESGAAKEVIGAKVEEFVNAIADETEKGKTQKILGGCKKVFQVARRRRDHHTLDEAMGKYLTWLSETQKTALKDLYAAGNKEEMYKKILEFFEATSGDAKKNAAEQLKGACRHFITDAIGSEKADQIKALKESGSSYEDIAAKVKEFVDAIGDGPVKERATKLLHGCQIVYKAAAASRKRRDHHHTLEEALEKFLSWTTEDQKNTLKELYAAGNKEEVYKKILEFYKETTGETKETATKELKGACRHFISDAIGSEKADQIKAMKEEGKPDDEIAIKIKEFIDAIADDAVKSRATKTFEGCKLVYKAASRKRRDHHHTLEEALEKFLTWLTEDQKTTLKDLYAAGNKEEVYRKIMEFYKETSGETKDTAAQQLKGACRHFIAEAIGSEKADEIKAMKEGGKTDDEIAVKVKEFIDAIADDSVKARATRTFDGCKLVYKAAASRKRRDHHHTLEEALEKFLTWLTEDQKTTLKDLYAAGNKEEVYKKIMEFYKATSGETKDTASKQLKGACRHFISDAIGSEKADQIKALKEGGKSDDEIAVKIKEFIDAIADDSVKARATRTFEGCKLAYKAAASRKRRDHHHTLEEALEKFLTWLTEDQKTTLKDLYAAGNKEEIYKKIMEFYKETSGETKDTAAKQLKGACRHFISDAIGSEKADQIKAMKEGGQSDDEIAVKIKEFIDAIADDSVKARATRTFEGCKLVYKAAASRKRRDHHHTLEEALEKFLTWLTEDQKTTLKDLYAAGNKEEVYKKIMEFYKETSGETKDTASKQLKGACRHFISDAIGSEKADQIKAMKEEGQSDDEIAVKIKEFIDAIADDSVKARATRTFEGCKLVYKAAASRKRRDHHHTLEEALEKFLTWLTEDQKTTLKDLYAAGNKEEVYKKIMEFYKETSGDTKDTASKQLKGACRHFISEAIGSEKADQIKAMKEGGKSDDEIATKIKEFIDAIADDSVKGRATRTFEGCKLVYKN